MQYFSTCLALFSKWSKIQHEKKTNRGIRPFPLYGTKLRLVGHYPQPRYPIIIEPFLGAGAYVCHHWKHDVIAFEKDPWIYEVWQFIQRTSAREILSLPLLKDGQTLDDFTSLSEVEQHFIGFWLSRGVTRPNRTPSPDRCGWDVQTRQMVADNLWRWRHFKIIQGDYREAPDIEATYFIDAPYQHGGHRYRESNRSFDYSALTEFIQARCGQVIVCENSKNTWMSEFKKIRTQRGNMFQTVEGVWLRNVPSNPIGVNSLG